MVGGTTGTGASLKPEVVENKAIQIGKDKRRNDADQNNLGSAHWR